MRKTKLISMGITIVIALAVANTAFANNSIDKREIIQQLNSTLIIKPFSDQQATPKPMQIIRFNVVCPDGSEQMAGAVGIHTNAAGQITQIDYDNWGYDMACRDNQLYYFA